MTVGLTRQGATEKLISSRSNPVVSNSAAGGGGFANLLSSVSDGTILAKGASILTTDTAMRMLQSGNRVAVSSAWALDDALTPVSVADSPLEQPVVEPVAEPIAEPVSVVEQQTENAVLISNVGNETADDLVNRVMSIRSINGKSTDAQVRSVANAQTYLKALGYDIGAFGPYSNGVDGVLGDYTKAALQQFQQDTGLETTGRVDAETVTRLGETALIKMQQIDTAWEQELANSTYNKNDYSGVANPFWYVSFVVGKGDDAETMGNIDPVFKGRLAALARDTGHGFRFGEGYRSYERQAYLYDQYINNGGPLAAKPGESNHNKGLAVDTQSTWLQQLEDRMVVSDQHVLKMYGLYKPLAASKGIAHENWHIQPLELWPGQSNS